MRTVKNRYGFSGTIKQALRDEIDSSPGYSDGRIESLERKVERISELLTSFMASQIKDAEQLNEILGWGQYEDE